MKPHWSNACSGRYRDWLEVNLLPECNGSCAWCIERSGWHPARRVCWPKLVSAAVTSGRQNVQLLGGEPTLHRDLGSIVNGLVCAKRKVWITTNGSRLSGEYVQRVLAGVSGVNVSVHHYDLAANADITGVEPDFGTLQSAVGKLHELGATVRLNCTCINGAIDSRSEMSRYIEYLARPLGADAVRFAELKGDTDSFVNLTRVLGGDYGLTEDPFRFGCSLDTMIDGMPVNLRIMCGLQTKCRPAPESPEQVTSPVLYYDGVLYPGWQLQEGRPMDGAMVRSLAVDGVMDKLAAGKIDDEEARRLLKSIAEAEMASVQQPRRETSAQGRGDLSRFRGSDCQY